MGDHVSVAESNWIKKLIKTYALSAHIKDARTVFINDSLIPNLTNSEIKSEGTFAVSVKISFISKL